MGIFRIKKRRVTKRHLDGYLNFTKNGMLLEFDWTVSGKIPLAGRRWTWKPFGRSR